MAGFVFLDVVPDPVRPAGAGLGVAAAVILFVIGLVILLAALLVVFLWYRKRSRSHLEIARADNEPQIPNLATTQPESRTRPK